MGILPNYRSQFDLMPAKVMFKVIQLEGFVCVIYMLSSICSSNIMLVIIFSRFQQILTDYCVSLPLS